MADADAAPTPPSPLSQAADRLAWEAQYVRDVLHLSRGGVCSVSSRSLQSLYEGLVAVLDVVRAAAPLTAPPVTTPAAGGTPAPTTGG